MSHDEPPPPERGNGLVRLSAGDLLILPTMPPSEQRRSDLARDVTPPVATSGRGGPTPSAPPHARSPQSGSECTCGGAGWYSPGPTLGKAERARLIRCPCQTGADAARLTTLLRTNRGRFARATIANFDAERDVPAPECWQRSLYDPDADEWRDQWFEPAAQRQMLRRAKATLGAYAERPGGWIWLQGNYGSGKSHLGAAVANALAARGHSTHYDTVPQLVKLLRAGIKDHSVDERLDLLARVELLMLDDIGMGNVSGWGDGQIEDLINERYNAERWTILTSNVPIEAIGGRMGSRIVGECEIVTLVAYDIRLLHNGEHHDNRH